MTIDLTAHPARGTGAPSPVDTFDPRTVSWVMDKADLKHLAEEIKASPAVVYDLETTGLDEHAVTHGPSNGGVAARIVLASFTLPNEEDGEQLGEPSTYLVPLSHPESPWLGSWATASRVLAKAMRDSWGVLVGHNIKYDHRWIYACTRIPGVPAGQPVFDKEDEDLFKKGHISNTGYWRIYIPGGPTSGVAAHDLIAERFLGPKPEGYSVDHWNRDTLDNRRANLRYVTRAEQMQNRENWGASGVRGAYPKKSGRYEAALTIQGKRKYLGTFATAEEAGAAVDAFQQRAGQKPPRSVREVPGVDLSHRTLWDTMISSHLLDENDSTKLKDRAPDTFGVARWDDVDLKHPGAAEEEPLFKLGMYAARDTYWTWKLFDAHRARMLPRHTDDLFGDEITEARLGDLAVNVAMPTTATLTAMEQRGMILDLEWGAGRIETEEGIRDSAYEDLVARYVGEGLDGVAPSFAPTSKWFRVWSEKAVENGDLRVAALTPQGKPQWSKKVLEKQARGGSEVAQALLDYRGAVKRLEYLGSWRDKVSREGTIHANYNAGSVLTGRLSSSGPNMQQVTKALKPAFMPSPGYYLAELDYSQIELRVAAFISRCAPMINAFKNGEDLHRLIAARINAKDPSEVTAEERQQGKAANFGLLYGMGATGFRDYAEDVYGVHFTEQEAHQVHEAFFQMWEGIRAWHGRAVVRANEQGEIISPIGRVRRVPDVWDGNDRIAGAAERQAINSPVQGFASDIMQIAAACIEGNIYGVEPVDGARLVGTVHDSILVEVDAERWEDVTAACRRMMETEVPHVLERMGCEFDVPLVADAEVGSRWGMTDIGEM